MGDITLRAGGLELSFCGKSGVLRGLRAEETGWEILGGHGYGLSWRMMLPLSEEMRNNDVLGEKQKISSVETAEGVVTLRWEGVTSERGGRHDINVTLTVRAERGAAQYEMEIENKSGYVVENIYCPYLIDVNAPDGEKRLVSVTQSYCGAREMEIWPCFINTVGYYGVDYPTQVHGCSPESPFVLFLADSQGLFMGIAGDDPSPVSWFGELRPGYESSIDGRVTAGRVIAGKPVEKRYAALHVPYIMPGEKRALSKIMLRAFRGGWQAGADIYAAHLKTWMKPSLPPDWAREPHAWQQLHINSPEDELRMRFTDLPKVAEICKRHGVKAIQLVGWNDGGQDQGNPSHDPDPRLGTFEDLRDAIAKCHELGVKIILFSKFTWADRGTKAFREKYVKHAVKDPYGDYYMHGGYRYQTGTQILDINTKRLIPMCFGDDGYMEACEREFKKLVELGAAGMLFDECQHHKPAICCFDESHGHRYGWPVYANDREFIRRLRALKDTPDDFLFAGEACYNWELEQYQLAYYRTESKTHIPLSRYILPGCLHMTAVTGFDDRNMINQCLMFGFVVSYEPFNFKGSLDDYPDTMAYGRRMDELRARHRKWFWDGEYRGTECAEVTGSGGEPHPTFSVFRAADSSIGAVVCNYEDDPVAVRARKTGGGSFERWCLVDGEGFSNAHGKIVIPARSAAVLLG